jgi:tetratricopeptide (TPR) repeat protein
VRDLYDVASLGSRLEQHLNSVAAGQAIGEDAPLRLAQELERRHLHAPIVAQLRRYHALQSSQNLAAPPLAVPLSAWDHYVRGRMLSGRNQWSGAAEQFNQAIELDHRVAVFYFEAGHCALQLAQYGEARGCFTTCIAIIHVEQLDQTTAQLNSAKNAALAACFCNRGLAEMGLRHWSQAEKDLSRALAMEPELADAWLNRAIVNRQRGQIRAAVADLERALELNASPARVHYLRALCFREDGEWEEVRAEVQKARQHADCPPEITILEQELQQKRQKD